MRTKQQPAGAMRPFTTPELAISASDFLRVECAGCGHDLLIPAMGLTQGLRLPPHMPIFDLQNRFRYRECVRIPDEVGHRLNEPAGAGVG